jgi:hypothetical protein
MVENHDFSLELLIDEVAVKAYKEVAQRYAEDSKLIHLQGRCKQISEVMADLLKDRGIRNRIMGRGTPEKRLYFPDGRPVNFHDHLEIQENYRVVILRRFFL